MLSIDPVISVGNFLPYVAIIIKTKASAIGTVRGLMGGARMKAREMYELRKNGATLQEIADTCGISRQRVHQILNQYNKSALEKAIELLKKQYDRAIKLSYVRNPVAWALYQTWRLVDKSEGKE